MTGVGNGPVHLPRRWDARPRKLRLSNWTWFRFGRENRPSGGQHCRRSHNLTGPNPTDRAKRGTKYHVAVDGEGVPVACAVTAANVNDTLASSACGLPRAQVGRAWRREGGA